MPQQKGWQMDWNGWHAIAQQRGDGLRVELLQGLEHVAQQATCVIEFKAYRSEFPRKYQHEAVFGSEACTIIPFPAVAKKYAAQKQHHSKDGLKPRQSRARNLARPPRDKI